MIDIAAGILLLLGGAFGFLAALGLVRLPDAIIRMHAATKAGTLGCGFILLGVAVYFPDTPTTLRAVAAILLVLLTAPIAAHLIGRAAYRSGIRLWHGTWTDELQKDREKRHRPTKRPPRRGGRQGGRRRSRDS
jgi:multicomponent Na+:H+ antiporter subunit G